MSEKRIYFMIESILSFLLSIYSMVVASETVKETINELKKAYANFPQSFQDRVIGIYDNSGVALIVIFAIIVMISSIILFIFSKNNTLLKHKGLVITLSIFTFIFTDRLLVQLLGIVSFIVILSCESEIEFLSVYSYSKEITFEELKKLSNILDIYTIFEY